MDPEKGDEVVADTWDKIAELLLGQGAKEQDTHTVETMIAFIRNDPNYDELVAPFEAALEKDGLKLPESVQTLEDKHIGRIKELSGILLNSVRMI